MPKARLCDIFHDGEVYLPACVIDGLLDPEDRTHFLAHQH